MQNLILLPMKKRKKMMQNHDEVSERVAMIESLKRIRAFLVSLKENLDKKDQPIEGIIDNPEANT